MDRPKTPQEALDQLRRHYFDTYSGGHTLDLIQAYVELSIEEALRNVVVSTEEDLEAINDAVDQYGWAEGDGEKKEVVWQFMRNVNGALKLREVKKP